MKFRIINFKYADYLTIFLGLFVITFWAAPAVFTPNQIGIFDWDTSMQRFEALYISIVKYRQWPGLNPWIGGGQPLLSNPGVSIFSIEGLFVLIGGTFFGLRAALLFYLFAGFIGAWKLSQLFCQERLLRLTFALYITFNAAVAYHVAVGHLVFLNFFLVPWFFYYVLKTQDDPWSGFKSALVFGLAFLSSPIYVVQYSLLIAFGIFIWRWWQASQYQKYLYASWIFLFIPTVGALIFYRVLTILFTAFDFSRQSGWKAHFDLMSILKFFFYPFESLEILNNIDGLGIGTWELSCYVGFVAAFLCLISLRQGVRWFHIILAILIWADVGNDSWYYLMFWIQKLPFFDSHQTFMRVRMFIPLFVGISAIVGLSILRDSATPLVPSKFKKALVLFLSILMVSEVLIVSHRILSLSHRPIPYDSVFNSAANFTSITRLPRSMDLPPEVGSSYDATRNNLGWIKGSDSYIPASNVRVGKDEPDYVSEYTQEGRIITPVYWSPNRILFEGLTIGTPLIINVNPGNPWHSNGVKLFPSYKITEPLKVFEVMPNDSGVVELNYIYPGRLIGALGTLTFLVFACYAAFITRRRLSRKYN